MKVTVILERGLDGTYDAYLKESYGLSFGLLGLGPTAKDAIADLHNSYEEAKALCANDSTPCPPLEFSYQYDVASFLNFYSTILTLSGLEKITGINQGQLSHYLTGKSKPRPSTIKKIETALHQFARGMEEVRFFI